MIPTQRQTSVAPDPAGGPLTTLPRESFVLALTDGPPRRVCQKASRRRSRLTQQGRFHKKASLLFGLRSPRSERFRSCTCPIQCNTCATGAPETLTHQGLQAIASLCPQSVAKSAYRQHERLGGTPRVKSVDLRTNRPVRAGEREMVAGRRFWFGGRQHRQQPKRPSNRWPDRPCFHHVPREERHGGRTNLCTGYQPSDNSADSRGSGGLHQHDARTRGASAAIVMGGSPLSRSARLLMAEAPINAMLSASRISSITAIC